MVILFFNFTYNLTAYLCTPRPSLGQKMYICKNNQFSKLKIEFVISYLVTLFTTAYKTKMLSELK